ncbi:hypothetical protein [Frankia canadensis]|uniref:hypothetical protein n=1 Tax=Frankia canadensis TaxID=1836972 RepID=UPI001054FF9F|nr:hypothetical protein [Frankia canadensis]
MSLREVLRRPLALGVVDVERGGGPGTEVRNRRQAEQTGRPSFLLAEALVAEALVVEYEAGTDGPVRG